MDGTQSSRFYNCFTNQKNSVIKQNYNNLEQLNTHTITHTVELKQICEKIKLKKKNKKNCKTNNYNNQMQRMLGIWFIHMYLDL